MSKVNKIPNTNESPSPEWFVREGISREEFTEALMRFVDKVDRLINRSALMRPRTKERLMNEVFHQVEFLTDLHWMLGLSATFDASVQACFWDEKAYAGALKVIAEIVTWRNTCLG